MLYVEKRESRPAGQAPASSYVSKQVGEHGREQSSKIAIFSLHRRVFQVDRQSQEQDGAVQTVRVPQRKEVNQ